MARAMWNGVVIAESDVYERVEGNVYFPPGAVRAEYLQESRHRTFCGWKGGRASYYDVVVDGRRNENAAWYYPDVSPAAEPIRDHVAFWKGVVVEE